MNWTCFNKMIQFVCIKMYTFYNNKCVQDLAKNVCQTLKNGLKTLLYSSQSLHLCAFHLGKMLGFIKIAALFHLNTPAVEDKLILGLSSGLMDNLGTYSQRKGSKHQELLP